MIRAIAACVLAAASVSAASPMATPSPTPEPYPHSCSGGTWTADSLDITGEWAVGNFVSVAIRGTTSQKTTAGTVKYQIYETYVSSFIAQGNSPFFQCSHKGCDPSRPIALDLATPDADSSNYTLTFDFPVPAKVGQGDDEFRLVTWAQDQTHGYTVSCSFTWNLTATAAASTKSVALSNPESIDASPIHVTYQDGAFKLREISMGTFNGRWVAGDTATVTAYGVSTKIITAGTVKYQVYEQYQPTFIASGDSSYFSCNNKGCDPREPLALTLDRPESANSEFKLEFQFKMPLISAPGNNQFTITFWGEDQDHEPYDMSVSIQYNTTSTF